MLPTPTSLILNLKKKDVWNVDLLTSFNGNSSQDTRKYGARGFGSQQRLTLRKPFWKQKIRVFGFQEYLPVKCNWSWHSKNKKNQLAKSPNFCSLPINRSINIKTTKFTFSQNQLKTTSFISTVIMYHWLLSYIWKTVNFLPHLRASNQQNISPNETGLPFRTAMLHTATFCQSAN